MPRHGPLYSSELAFASAGAAGTRRHDGAGTRTLSERRASLLRPATSTSPRAFHALKSCRFLGAVGRRTNRRWFGLMGALASSVRFISFCYMYHGSSLISYPESFYVSPHLQDRVFNLWPTTLTVIRDVQRTPHGSPAYENDRQKEAPGEE